MRGKAKSSGRIRHEPKIPCGALRFELAPFPYTRRNFCDRWDCLKCQKRKIERIQDIFRNAYLVITAFVSERLPTKTPKEVNILRNFLKRKVVGEYWWVKSDSRTVIISKCKHPGATRMKVKDIIEVLIPEVLNEPWNQFCGNRFGRSHEKKVDEVVIEAGNIERVEPAKPFDNNPYARWTNEETGDNALDEFKALKTDYERAAWLIQNEKGVVLYDRGHKILKQYYYAEAAMRSAAGVQCTI